MDVFLCRYCHLIIKGKDLLDGKCPKCKNNVEQTCPTCGHPHIKSCGQEVFEMVRYCPTCKDPVCPHIDENGVPCGSFDVTVISRVTGYLQDVKGWNKAKKQELKDRQRYDL